MTGINDNHRNFFVCLVFLRSEEEQDYEWAIDQLVKHLHTGADTVWPAVVVTDRQLALTNAIVSKYPRQTTNTILCRWHINKNVLKKMPWGLRNHGQVVACHPR
jgi:MULE transposase domain